MVAKISFELNTKDFLDDIAKSYQSEFDGVKVGVLGSQEGNLALIASVHEFGTDIAGKNNDIRIPERSFIRSTLDERSREIDEFVAIQVDLMNEGKQDRASSLRKIGVFLQALIRNKINTGPFEANAPSTIASKGSARPLVDTGRLLQSINFELTRVDQ